MNLFLLGELDSTNTTIKSISDNRGYTFTSTKPITSAAKFLDAARKSANCEIVILDILSYSIEDNAFEEGIKYLAEHCKGIIIIYAPNTYQNAKVKICNKYGINNIITAFMSAGVRAKFNQLVPIDYKQNNENHERMNNANNRTPSSEVKKPPAIKPITKQNAEKNISHKQLGDMVNTTQPTYQTAPQPPAQPQIQQPVTNTQPTYQTAQPQVDDIIIRKKIGVLGIIPRIGTTTQAIQLVKAIQSEGITACYVQENNSEFLEDMENYFSDIEKDTERNCLIYEGMEFYGNKNSTYSRDYNYIVIDYGSCGETKQIPSDFYNNDIRIVVCGGTAEEVSALTNISRQLYADENIIYIFSFIADYEREDILDLVSDRRSNVYFAPYTPDCYSINEENISNFKSVLGIKEKIETKPTKKRGLRRKKERR